MNTIIGEERHCVTVEKYGLGKGNSRGDFLVKFCVRNNILLTSTYFEHHPRKKYTWNMQENKKKFYVDYILMKNRFRNQGKTCHRFPGADVDSDCILIILKCCLKF